ncbi:MAG: U32 family peptidase [Lachnospiraceae bacterium]|nr:U32 family peptidase [Lachnospiraceae bacterium]
MDENKLEILAPAGSMESLRAAVNAGADAVYMGGSRFGARAYAQNPDPDGLLGAIDYAHSYGVRFYLTVNTLLKERELEGELFPYLKPLYERGVDAVLVQDMGVLCALREWFPDLPLHASTQMTLCGAGGLKILQKLGVERAVLSRELSLAEIRRIHEECDMELECFVHGALCYCYSGQCLFSSLLGGRSGNRGRCAQPCRLLYDALDVEGKLRSRKGEQALLSPKDLCAVDLIPQLAEAGVSSLKIEGRMKRPEYVAGVTRIYRKYVDRYLEHGAEGYRVSEEDRRELLLLFNRDGFSRGYYEQHNGRNLMALWNKEATEREKQAYEKRIATLYEEYVEHEWSIAIDGELRAWEGEPLELTLSCGEATVTVRGETAQTAQNQPMEAAQLEKQLRKTGGTAFQWKSLVIQTEGNIFVPVSALNSLRRKGLEALRERMLSPYRRDAVKRRMETSADDCSQGTAEPSIISVDVNSQGAAGLPIISADENTRREKTRQQTSQRDMRLHISVESETQLKAVLTAVEKLKNAGIPLEYIYVDETLTGQLPRIHAAGLKACILMPPVFREKTEERWEKSFAQMRNMQPDGFVICSLEEYEFLRRAGWEGEIFSEHRLYTFNSRSRRFWREQGLSMQTNPLELNERELKEISASDSIQLIYGRYPMMTTAGCLHRTLDACRGKSEQWTLRDRRGKDFPVKNVCRDCYNIIYNSQPLYLFDEMERVCALGCGAVRILFTTEDAIETKAVLDAWFCRGKWEGEFTRGHLKRGVE